MPEKIPMIALSPTMETGTIARWRKKEGDKVASGDVLCEVETDEATMDYESSSEGTLLKILLPEGGQAKVGDPIAIIVKPGEDISSLVAESAKAPAAPPGVKPAPAVTAVRDTHPAASPAAAVPRAAAADGRVRSSPLARKIAQAK